MARRRYRYSARRSYRGRRFRYSTRSFSRRFRRGNSFGITKSLFFWAPAAIAACTTLDDKIPAQIKLLAATMPIRGRGEVGMIKSAARGLIFGDVVNQMTGNKLQLNRGKSSGSIL